MSSLRTDHSTALRRFACVTAFLTAFVSANPTAGYAQANPDVIWMQGGHTDTVNAMAWSPDGQWVASGARDSSVKLWRVSDGRLLRIFDYFRPFAVAFSPDGTLIAAGGADNDVRVWRVSDGAVIQSFRGHSNNVHSVQFSSDGALIVSAGKDLVARLWRVADAAPVHTFPGHTGIIAQAIMSPDGAWIASWATAEVFLWRATDGSRVHAFTNLVGTRQVAFSPDSTQMAWLQTSYTNVTLLRVNDGAIVRRIGEGQTSEIHQIDYLADGQRLSTLHASGALRLWRISDGALLQQLDSEFPITGMAISPDNTQVAMGGPAPPPASIGQQVGVRSLDSGQPMRRFSAYDRVVSDLAVSPDSALVAAANSDAIRIWRTVDGTLLLTITNQAGRNINALALSPDGLRLAAALSDRPNPTINHTIEFWDLKTGQHTGALPGHTNTINTIAYSGDGQYLASGSADRTVKLWRLSDGTEVQTFIGNSNSVRRVTFNPNGTLLAAAGTGSSVRLWRVSDGALLWTTNIAPFGAFDFAFAPDGQILALAASNGFLQLWRASDGLFLAALTGHNETVYATAFSPDGKFLVSGGDVTLRVWEVATRSLVTTYDQDLARVRALAISPDGQYLAYGRVDGVLVVATAPGSSPRIRLRAVDYSETTGFHLRVSGPSNQQLRVEMSTDFRNWSPLTNVAGLTGEIDVRDPATGAVPLRFYRVVAE